MIKTEQLQSQQQTQVHGLIGDLRILFFGLRKFGFEFYLKQCEILGTIQILSNAKFSMFDPQILLVMELVRIFYCLTKSLSPIPSEVLRNF